MTNAPEPAYVAETRIHMQRPQATRLEVERYILKYWKAAWSRPGGVSPTGHGFTGHLIVYTIHMFPRLDMNPWLRRMLSSFEFTYFKHGRQICNLIGSQNSGKTDYFATFAMIILSIDPEFTAIYAGSPYLSAAESGQWGRIRKRNLDGEKAGRAYKEVDGGNKIQAMKLPESGMIELRAFDKVGKLQGKKQPDETGMRGWFILLCDEIALFQTQELKELLDNLQGNVRFFCYTGCNFRSVNDLAGVLCKPEGREFSSLDADRDQRWLSECRSVTYRFDGHRSPNIVAGKVIYSYLFKESDRQRLEEVHGLTGPKYLEQARSFPFSSDIAQLITTRDQINAFGGFQEPVWAAQTVRVAFCDAAFGGDDPCKFGIYEFGYSRCEDSEGKWHNRQVFSPVVSHMTIKIDTTMTLTKEWAERVKTLNPKGQYQFQALGSKVSADQQIAVHCGEKCREWGIPLDCFGFDGSMRSEFTQEMITVLGNSIVALDFGGRPTERPGDPATGQTALEVYSTFVAEIYFAVGNLVRAGQMRGAKKIDKAISQLTKRWWKYRGTKKTIQPKNDLGKGDTALKLKSYKKEFNESPDDADTLVGAVEIMRRKGLWPEQSRTKGVSDATANLPGGPGAVAIAAQLNRMLRPAARQLHSTHSR